MSFTSNTADHVPDKGNKPSGVTLIELLVIVSVISILAVAATQFTRATMTRSLDARRKADIKRISNALEQYANDHGGYPRLLSSVNNSISACGVNTVLSPYLKDVPCDVNPKRPYVYDPEGAPILGRRAPEQVHLAYRLLTRLEYLSDPIINERCPGSDGCGGRYVTTLGGGDTSDNRLNYGIGVGVAVEQP